MPSQQGSWRDQPTRPQRGREQPGHRRQYRGRRTEVTDRMLILSERHLRLVLAKYEAHYNGRRLHRSCQLGPPRPDYLGTDISQKQIKRRPVIGGLINEYERVA